MRFVQPFTTTGIKPLGSTLEIQVNSIYFEANIVGTDLKYQKPKNKLYQLLKLILKTLYDTVLCPTKGKWPSHIQLNTDP